jgi:hypothetical protein
VPTYDEDDDNDRPRRRPKRKKSSAGTVVLVIGVIGLLGLCVVGGLGYALYTALFKPIAFAPGDWREQAVPDGGCAALFPGPPQSQPIPDLAAPASGRKFVYEPGGRDAAFMFGYLDVPIALAGDDYFEQCYQAEKDVVGRA